MKLVERHIIRPEHGFYEEIDSLSFLSKNLYNTTLYTIRQHYFNTHSYFDYFKVWRLFTDENQVDFRALPNKVSKATMRLVDKNFKSFFSLLNKKNNGNYDKPISIPDYLHKTKGRFLVHYEKGALSFKEKGYIKLSKTNIRVKTNLSKEEVNFVRLVPKNSYYVIEVGYTIKEKEERTGGEVASIDLGLNNLMTIAMPSGDNLIVNGKPLKFINQYYNKKLAKYKSELPKNVYTSKRINKLTLKRNNKVEDYLHKASRLLVNILKENKVSTLVIGYNKGVKENINLGKVNNQNIVQIPMNKLVQQLEYKCRLEGIRVEYQEESYTSKSSFLDKDILPVYKEGKVVNYTFKGKRVKRGLYKTLCGNLINADLNGAYNILKKYLKRKGVWNNSLELDYIEACRKPRLRRLSVAFN